MDKEIGIIVAAGLGNRMRPLTETVPKPLIEAGERPMIESVIAGLKTRGISEIYVVVGYLKEQFSYLTKKYQGLTLLENTEYETKNNIFSLYAARNVLGKGDCFICEADLLVMDPGLFERALDHSGYFGKMVSGYSDDWIFEQRNGWISRIKKGGTDVYHMVGISYFKKEDAKLLAQKITQACQNEENGELFWDQVVDQNLQELRMKVFPVKEGQIVEIDTVEELKNVRDSWNLRNR